MNEGNNFSQRRSRLLRLLRVRFHSPLCRDAADGGTEENNAAAAESGVHASAHRTITVCGKKKDQEHLLLMRPNESTTDSLISTPGFESIQAVAEVVDKHVFIQ